MTVLVIGKTGQVGRSLLALVVQQKLREFIFAGRDEIDLEDSQKIAEFIDKTQPKIIVNVAAWTAVDDAENEVDRTEIVNSIAVGEIAKAAKKHNAHFIHLSTDYVYDGNKSDAYVETDMVNPQGVYGRTKLAGENRIRQIHENHLILRTSWVFSPYGKNFVKTMLSLSERMDKIRVINDQFGCPTSAEDIANCIVHIIGKWQKGERTGLSQTFHCVGSGNTNWANFSRYIFEVKQELDGRSILVEEITSKEWDAKAKRPANSVLDCAKLEKVFDIQMPFWKQSAAKTIKKIMTDSTE